MNTLVQSLVNHIKSVKIKFVILALLLATIFTFFSQHLYVNSNYWQNAYALPEMSFLRIEYKKENTDPNLIRASKFDLQELQNFPNTNFEYKKKKLSEDTDQYTILLSISPTENINHMKIGAKIAGTLKFKLEK